MNELVSASEDRAPSRRTRWRDGLRVALRAAVDVALPPLCPSCRTPLAGGTGLCTACWSKLSLIEPPYGARLSIPSAYDPGPGSLSMEAIANPPAYDRARAAAHYDDTARALVLSLKYNDRLDLAPMLGRWIARAGRELIAGADALLHVPLRWRHPWARRFNQSAALAVAISNICGVPVQHNALKRVRATPQQDGLSKTERVDNVQGAFRVLAKKTAVVTGRRLVLIDGVPASGATVDTCARTLLHAGAAHVDLLVLARVVAPLRVPI